MTRLRALTSQERRAVLYLEAAALLHDVGKLSNGFLKDQASDCPGEFHYDYGIVINPLEALPLALLLSKQGFGRVDVLLKNAANPDRGAPFGDIATAMSGPALTQHLLTHTLVWDSTTYSLAELLLFGKQRFLKTDFLRILEKTMHPAKLIGRLHGAAHYEKEKNPSVPKGVQTLVQASRQPYAATYAATPFGWEAPGASILVDTPGKDLTNLLQTLPWQDIGHIQGSQKDRTAWLDQIRQALQQGIADNQRPTNEVTLWDWGYTVAALTKAAAVWILHQGHWPNDLNAIPFRTLAIGLDRLDVYSRADKITDLLGLRNTLDASYAQVRRLLEEELALGNPLFRDETGSYYLLPDLDGIPSLYERILAVFPPDLRPHLKQGESVTVGNLDPRAETNLDAIRRLLADPRRSVVEARLKPPELERVSVDWDGVWREPRPSNAEVCPVCGIRPVGYPESRVGEASQFETVPAWATSERAKARKICRVCLARRVTTASAWAQRGFTGTVWTDEVADINSRLALLVGRLDLEGWLDGTLLSSLLVHAHTANGGEVHTAKNPSPARLYRIVETARAFWAHTAQTLIPQVTGQRPFRLALIPDAASRDALDGRLVPSQAYEVDVDGLALGVIWDASGRRLITIENLGYFVKLWSATQLEARLSPREQLARLQDRLQDQDRRLLVREPSVYGRRTTPLAEIRVVRVDPIEPAYPPAIELSIEPGLYMGLVPAESALDVAQSIKQKYDAEMGRVRDRLPLYLGLVFFPRHTPLRAVLDAGRKLLQMAGKWHWEEWQVVDAQPSTAHIYRTGNQPSGVDTRTLLFANGVRWTVPVVAGDGTTADGWYPNLYRYPPSQRADASAVAPPVRHVGQIVPATASTTTNADDKVAVRPSRFDFEFLDTTARRFDIRYNEMGRRISRPTRPFLLEDLDRLQRIWDELCYLALSQRHQVVRTIEDARAAWQTAAPAGTNDAGPVFTQLVHDTLAGAQWPKQHHWRDLDLATRTLLVRAGVSGELADITELYMQILQPRPSSDDRIDLEALPPIESPAPQPAVERTEAYG